MRLGEGDAEDDERAKRLALKREVLAKMPLFARLTERELLRVMQVVEVRELRRTAQVVIREGDKGDELFIVLSRQGQGRRAAARRSRGSARASTSARWRSSAACRARRPCTPTAPRELIAIRRADFFEILRKEHELAVKMLWQFLGVLADRLDQTSQRACAGAGAELAAEDVTAEIFPDRHGRRRRDDRSLRPARAQGPSGSTSP